jgi:hypothetical protein
MNRPSFFFSGTKENCRPSKKCTDVHVDMSEVRTRESWFWKQIANQRAKDHGETRGAQV